MPFPMKIQPIDFNTPEAPISYDTVKPVAKSRFKRLFDFPSFLRVSAADRAGAGAGAVDELQFAKDGGSEEFEPSSVCLDKMVQNFMEGNCNEKQSSAAPIRCCRHQCNCFKCKSIDSSDDEFDSFNCFGNSSHSSSSDACELLKTLVLCESASERNLLADTAKIVEKNKICRRKDEFSRKIVTDGLSALGYDASICKSRWEKSPSYPAGEYEYTDVLVGGERLIMDIDFRSEFEIARSTKTYKAMLQTLPQIFVGKGDRLQRIIQIVSEAAKQSLKKKGMHFPPWRKADYVKAKWLSPYTRATLTKNQDTTENKTCETDPEPDVKDSILIGKTSSCQEEKSFFSSEEEIDAVMVKKWEPLQEIKMKVSKGGVKVVSGLASVIENT